MDDAQGLALRQVAVWNQSDPNRRHRLIVALSAPDAQHCVDVCEARGYHALEKRIVGQKNVQDGAHPFRAALRDIVTFHREMPADSETVVARGFEVLIADNASRILVNDQLVFNRAPGNA